MRTPLLLLDASGLLLGFTTDGTSYSLDLPEGGTVDFAPGGEVERLPIRTAPIVGQPAGDQSFSFSISGQAIGDLWAARRTNPIQVATARLYWWEPGTTLRLVDEVFRGTVRDPSWDLAALTLSASVQPTRRSDDAPLPPALLSDEGRFFNLPETSLDYAAPVVYGCARGVPLRAVTSALVDPVRLIVAGHPLKSTTIQVARDGVNVGVARPVFNAIDERGSAYSYVEVTPAVLAAGEELYAVEVEGWAIGNRLIDRLGDVMKHLVRTYAPTLWSQLDLPRVSAAEASLNRIGVAFYLNERGGNTVLSFLEQQLGAQFPVAFSSAAGKFGWDSRIMPQTGDPPAAHLVYGQDTFDRIGPVETSADDVISEVELTFGYDGFAGSDVQALRGSSTSFGGLRRSLTRWGLNPVVSESAPYVVDESSAYLLLTDRVLRLGKVRVRVEYHALPDSWFFLPLQSVVLVTDDDLGWVEEPCLFEQAEARPDGRVDVVLVSVEGV